MSNEASVVSNGVQHRSRSRSPVPPPFRWNVDNSTSPQGVAAAKGVDVELAQASPRHRRPASSAQAAAPIQAEDGSLLQRQAQAVEAKEVASSDSEAENQGLISGTSAPDIRNSQKRSSFTDFFACSVGLGFGLGFSGMFLFDILKSSAAAEENKGIFNVLWWVSAAMFGYAFLAIIVACIWECCCRRS